MQALKNSHLIFLVGLERDKIGDCFGIFKVVWCKLFYVQMISGCYEQTSDQNSILKFKWPHAKFHK